MKTFKEYLEYLSESKYYTHGVQHVKRTIPKHMFAYELKYDLDINKDTNDFQLYIYNNEKFTIKKFHSVIGLCEMLGYFPSYLIIDDRNIFDEYKKYVYQINIVENNKIDIDFIDFLRNVDFGIFKEICLQFESYQETDIDIPDFLYHVCRKIDIDSIKKNGLQPRSKNKISFHPDRVYFDVDLNSSKERIEEFKNIEDNEYSIVEIKPDNELKNYLKLKKDTNSNGFYTSQNISPIYINKIY